MRTDAFAYAPPDANAIHACCIVYLKLDDLSVLWPIVSPIFGSGQTVVYEVSGPVSVSSQSRSLVSPEGTPRPFADTDNRGGAYVTA